MASFVLRMSCFIIIFLFILYLFFILTIALARGLAAVYGLTVMRGDCYGGGGVYARENKIRSNSTLVFPPELSGAENERLAREKRETGRAGAGWRTFANTWNVINESCRDLSFNEKAINFREASDKRSFSSKCEQFFIYLFIFIRYLPFIPPLCLRKSAIRAGGVRRWYPHFS